MTRILIVDDHQAARTTLRELLDWHSFQVCGDAKDAAESVGPPYGSRCSMFKIEQCEDFTPYDAFFAGITIFDTVIVSPFMSPVSLTV
jgi:CheY-like chemotaxis protein